MGRKKKKKKKKKRIEGGLIYLGQGRFEGGEQGREGVGESAGVLLHRFKGA